MRTRVGYCGGEHPAPAYHNLGDHSEALQVDFDPAVISWEALLEIFWRSHNPVARSWSRQYRPVLFFHDARQSEIALSTRTALQAGLNSPVQTPVEPVGPFYRAEDYHQKYYLQRQPLLLAELQAHFTEFTGLVDSTLAARLNGYLGGHGSMEQLLGQMGGFGLSQSAWEALRTRGRR